MICEINNLNIYISKSMYLKCFIRFSPTPPTPISAWIWWRNGDEIWIRSSEMVLVRTRHSIMWRGEAVFIIMMPRTVLLMPWWHGRSPIWIRKIHLGALRWSPPRHLMVWWLVWYISITSVSCVIRWITPRWSIIPPVVHFTRKIT